MSERGFCPLCDVTLGLHDGPGTCDIAEAKADLLDRAFKFAPTAEADHA